MMAAIFSIGHGNRAINDFVSLLSKYEIEYLIDVRSKPYSRFNPDFSKSALEKSLVKHKIRYIYMGDLLGGFPDNKDCYTADGRVDYGKLKLQPNYHLGIDRLRNAWDQGLHVAIMCSELKPQHCHRSKLIGESLVEVAIPVLHIDESGEAKSHAQVIDEIKAEVLGAPIGQLPLFGDDRELSFTSRKRHNGGRAISDSSDEA